jgi:outer membrane murein-binding lipoprotein Lpp
MDTIIAYLFDKLPMLAVIIITAVTVWFIARMYQRFKNVETDVSAMEPRFNTLQTDVSAMEPRFNTLQTDVSVLKTDVSALKTDVSVLKTDVSALKTDVSVLKTDVSVLKTDVSALKTDVSVLKTDVFSLKNIVMDMDSKLGIVCNWVMKKDVQIVDALIPVKKNSPSMITPHGYALLELSGAKKCVEENFAFFEDYINKEKPVTKFDVEINAIRSAEASIHKEFIIPLKVFLYDTPTTMNIVANSRDGNPVELKIDTSWFAISQVMGIYVRDKYLALFDDNATQFYR